jgi:hypothetical protein
MLYFFRTRTGRVVYNRKKHAFNPSALLRIAWDIEAKSEVDAGVLAFALVIISTKITHFSGVAGEVLNLAEIWPEWFKFLDALGHEKWAADYNQKYPLKAAEIYANIEAWRARSAQREIEQASLIELQEEVARLRAENVALRDQMDDLLNPETA